MPTAAEAGLAACLECGLLSPSPGDAPRGRTPRPAALGGRGRGASPGYVRCPRCGAAVRLRREEAVGRTIALSAAAAICYIPANILPVLITSTPNGTEADTILDGVVLLYQSGSWFLALIVLVASVMIPIGKIAVLCVLCIVVVYRTRIDPHDCTRLFRTVEFIGRWSMLDVFVDAFVVGIVQLPPIMSVKPGLGVPFFAGTAVLTLLAAMSFDPRLVWDAHAEAAHDRA